MCPNESPRMRASATSLINALKVGVYTVLIAVGSTVLLADPTAEFGIVPIGVGIILLVHAVYRKQLERIEYAIIGLYATVVVGAIATATVMASDVQAPDIVTADGTVALVLAGALVVTYFISGWQSDSVVKRLQ